MHVDTGGCSARRRDGQPCSARAITTNGEHPVCFAHDADRQEALKASRSRGGKGRSTTVRASKHLPLHLRQMETRLLALVDELGTDTTKPSAALAIIAAVGKLLDLARFSLEAGETAALEARLVELEAQLARVGVRRDA